MISGKFIHNPNINLPSYGYGLPILPLEQFNILDISIKQKLMDSQIEISFNTLDVLVQSGVNKTAFVFVVPFQYIRCFGSINPFICLSCKINVSIH